MNKDWQRIPGLFNKREIKQMEKAGKEYCLKARGKDDWGQEVFAVHYRNKSEESVNE